MSADEARDFTPLDTHILRQLARAAETYAPHADVDARLTAILEAGTKNDHDDAAAADS
jgi:hypothetical protein